tara:strand:+ start:121 stop:795 length:675 start_codon:yes stop_codon:yes gene_type:complete
VKKLLLVGNGESFLDKNLSDKIDSFDIVCRFNFGGSKTSLDRGKDLVGSKKNIWFNFDFSNFVKDGQIITNPYNIEYMHTYDKIYINGIDWISNPTMAISTSIEQHLNLTSEQFNRLRTTEFTNLQDVCNTDIKNIWIFPMNHSEQIKMEVPIFGENLPTTGFRAIHLFLKTYDKIYLCGFDGGKTKHWDKNYGFHNTENGHNGFKEMKYIKELEKQQKIEFID